MINSQTNESKPLTSQNQIVDKIKNAFYNKKIGRNRMGVSESFYDPYYLIKSCFTLDQLEAMSEETLGNLLQLAEYAVDVFY